MKSTLRQPRLNQALVGKSSSVLDAHFFAASADAQGGSRARSPANP
jgi:hypothetical protein